MENFPFTPKPSEHFLTHFPFYFTDTDESGELIEVLDKIADLKPTPNSYILFADKENDFIISLTSL